MQQRGTQSPKQSHPCKHVWRWSISLLCRHQPAYTAALQVRLYFSPICCKILTLRNPTQSTSHYYQEALKTSCTRIRSRLSGLCCGTEVQGTLTSQASSHAPCCCCAVPGPKANRAAASGRRLGDLFASISLIHSTDEADIPDRVERARGEPRPVIHPRRVTSNLAE